MLLLDLSENKIEELPEEGFLYWLNSLRELNLSHNRIKIIPVRWWSVMVIGMASGG
jgi:Leucine-rich repeat (LRR) protein